MPSKLFRDISASTIQVLVNQLAGMVIFLLTSVCLSKEVYGELNWSIAVIAFITTVLSLRLDQILVQKMAAERDASKVMTIFTLHVFFSGIILWLLLFILSLLFPDFFSVHHLLLMIGVSQFITFFSSPFKQAANGKEQFRYLAIMSSASNVVRAAGLLIAFLFFELTAKWVVIIFIIGSVAELLLAYHLVINRMQIKLARNINFKDYALLLHESLPQIKTAILLACIGRMDWILLGLISTAAFTAEYSFAYRIFELSPVPMLIIAPVLLSRFSKFFASNTEKDFLNRSKEIKVLIRVEMLLATLIPLVLNIIWVPLLDPLTDGKYGASNATVFFLLSCCTPFQYITNIMWTAKFAQNKLKQILKITAVTFFIILAGDLVTIPLYGAVGAAVVYLAATIVEYINYMRASALSSIRETWLSLIIFIAVAAAAGFASFYLFDNVIWQLAFALSLFSLLLIATGQLRINDITFILQSLKRKETK